MTTLLTANLPLLASAPGGLSTLRRLVFNLAISGRLTTADDEASNAGSAIPAGWQATTVGSVTECLDRLRQPITKQDRRSGTVPYYGASGIVDYVADHIFDEPLVLVGEDGAKWGAGDATAFRIEGRAWVNNHAHVLRPDRTLVLDRFLELSLVAADLSTFITGMTVPKLNQARLNSIPLALPRLAEQHRIVAKVDELVALCDRLEARQQDAEATHARLVQALLDCLTNASDADEFQAGWTRLTAAFAETFTSDASIDALMQAIRALAFRGALSRVGATSWKQVSVHEAVGFLNGYAFKSEWFAPRGIRLVRNVNVSHGSLDWRDTACIPADRLDEFAAFALKEGDVLLTLDRPIISTGLKVAVVGAGDLPCLLLQRVARLTAKEDQIRPAFLLHWLRSPLFIEGIDPGRSNGVPHISTKQVGAMTIALPPLDEQDQIVAKLDELLALCEQLKARITAARGKHAQLAEALVEAAVA